eukprot:9769732-Ditylum_brightwellii.AAC.1
MPKKITKKSSDRDMAYTPAKKRFLMSNVGVVLPVSKHGWERVYAMYISVYGKKNRTVESLQWIFANLHQTRAPSGDPSMSEEIREAKLAWLQIRAKS